MNTSENFFIQSATDSPWADTMRSVLHHACLSPDPSTQNAAVIGGVTPSGYEIWEETWAVNEFPPGVAYAPQRWERPRKYDWIEHAERGAIFKAAKEGLSLQHATMVCPWAACADCARAIICSGISALVTLKPTPSATHERWDASISVAMEMFAEAGTTVIFIEGSLGCPFKLRRNGEEVSF